MCTKIRRDFYLTEISIKRPRGRPEKGKFQNPRKSASFGVRVDESELDLIDKRAEAVGLERSEYVRKLLTYSVRYMLSAEEHTEFAKRAKALKLSEYDYARWILTTYLKHGLKEALEHEKT